MSLSHLQVPMFDLLEKFDNQQIKNDIEAGRP